MKCWIALTILTTACVPLPYFSEIAAQVVQTAQEQSREDQRQEQQRAAERQWALDRARWLSVQQQQQVEAAKRQWEASQQEQAASRLRSESPPPQQPEIEQLQRRSALIAAEPHVNQPEQRSNLSIEQHDSLPPVEFSSGQPDLPIDVPLDTSAGAPLPTGSSSPPLDSALSAARQPAPTPRSSKKTEQRKPKPPARRYEVYQVLMCNDGTESPTCSCGGSRRGCCSHHGGVNGCATQRIPLDQ